MQQDLIVSPWHDERGEIPAFLLKFNCQYPEVASIAEKKLSCRDTIFRTLNLNRLIEFSQTNAKAPATYGLWDDDLQFTGSHHPLW